jgi:hypothetical protein
MMGVTEKIKIYKIRVKAVFILILMSSLFSCSVTGMEKSLVYPWDEKKAQILAWATAEKNERDTETPTDSQYWIQFYKKSIELRPDLDDFLYYAKEMIKVSRIYEEGRITKEQFEEKHRELTALFDQEENRRNQVLSSPRMIVNNNFEVGTFTCYRTSLLLTYVKDLQKRLRAAGPGFSGSYCDFFGDRIQCTSKNPVF